ncbi:MAG: signal recognition particle-docking protein FtsY [Deferribacteraceae bacterium]|jgi:fused signal recognition particle receptor|nr:signal recognition particle-docking protein FtsY [Deferribacteraceae bacterium]
MSVFERLKQGLEKTSRNFSSLFSSNSLDDEFWEELFERMVLTDMGSALAQELTAAARKTKDADAAVNILKNRITAIFRPNPEEAEASPKVVLVVGVNGTGKTTTTAKLAEREMKSGKKVCLAAADTFRAAAIEQLKSWADKIGCPIIAPNPGSDPAACAYDAVSYGVNNGCDTVIIDTAGRLHTKENLMQELRKIVRVCGNAKSGAPHESLLVLDGGSGQNGLAQAKVFKDMIGITHIVVTKLDGTAKGGIVLRIASELKIPVKYIGVGEKAEDLLDFEPRSFADAILRR